MKNWRCGRRTAKETAIEFLAAACYHVGMPISAGVDARPDSTGQLRALENESIGSIDRSIIRSINGSMDILTLSQAKLCIGRLVERALQGQPVVIRKGNRLVQLTEYVVPEPIPERPAGYFRRRPEDYRTGNAAAANHPPQR